MAIKWSNGWKKATSSYLVSCNLLFFASPFFATSPLSDPFSPWFFFFFWKWHNNEWVGRLPVGSRWQHNTSWSGLIGLRVSIHFIWVEGWVTCVLWFPMWVIFFVVSMLIERYDNGYEDGITIGKLFFCFYFVFVLWRMWILVNHHLLKLLKIKLEKKIQSHIISDN